MIGMGFRRIALAQGLIDPSVTDRAEPSVERDRPEDAAPPGAARAFDGSDMKHTEKNSFLSRS